MAKGANLAARTIVVKATIAPVTCASQARTAISRPAYGELRWHAGFAASMLAARRALHGTTLVGARGRSAAAAAGKERRAVAARSDGHRGHRRGGGVLLLPAPDCPAGAGGGRARPARRAGAA